MDETQKRQWCVYKHTNKINNKCYIGLTKNIKRRWKPLAYKKCIRFWNAIQKYGWDNFKHEILEDNLTLEEANEKEQYWISFYDSTNRSKGYNSLPGGGSMSGENHPWWGKKHTQEYKELLRKQMKEKWSNPEYRASACQNMKLNHANFQGSNHPEAKEVYCEELDVILGSCKDMAIYLNFPDMNLDTVAKGIARAARGERKTYKGYHFYYTIKEDKNES